MSKKSLHIFIAEDDPLLRRLYGQAFKLRGYSTEVAVNGEDAMEKIELLKDKPDLFLLDIMMPKLDGLAVLRGIKEDARYNKVPVIMLTNLSGRQSEGEAAIALGANAYLLKSAGDLTELFEQIERILG
jgi:CheY-like chemotaxis protein